MPGVPEVTFATTVDFLMRPDAYPHRPREVELIETHFACLFLAGQFVYKLKKPIRFHEIDFTTIAARRANCEAEVRLNRRLAATVYIGAVRIGVERGRLVLESGDPAVEWLVKMHRLPRDRMLDERALAEPIPEDELRRLVAKLAAFYARTAKAPWDGGEYRRRLERHIRATGAELAGYAPAVDAPLVERVVGEELKFLREAGSEIESRITQGRVVDAHGDLRPEHVCLRDDPQIIDCLEFADELRLLDTAEEIAYLALECRMLGQDELARTIIRLYREVTGDAAPRPLLDFYTRRRALVRALLCAWHLDEPLAAELREHWCARAQRYLETARSDGI